VAGTTYVLQYDPASTGLLTDSDQIWVVYAFDYWGTKVVQRLRGEGEQEDLFRNVLNPDEGRSLIKEMVRRGNRWSAEILVPVGASLISYYFTDGTRNDYNDRMTYVSYVYGEDGIPVRGARFRNIDFLIMAGKAHSAILEEIGDEIRDYPDHFIAHVVYWRFRFFNTVSPDTLMMLMEESTRHFSDLHDEYGDTVLNYKVLSLNDINRVMQLSLRERFDEEPVTKLREVVNSTILQTIKHIPSEKRLEQLPRIESIANIMLQTPAVRMGRELERMEQIMERLAERIELTRSEIDEISKSPADRSSFYLTVEEMPKIVGGIESIQRNIRYPESAKEQGIWGSVYVFAYIDEGGNVARTEIVRDPGGGLGEAAAAAVAQAKFIPGRQRGQPVAVRVSIPVHFRLAEPDLSRKETVIQVIEGPFELVNYITYPEDALKNEIQGEVHATVTLGEGARIVGIWIVSADDERFARATMEGILRYPFADDEKYRGVTDQKPVTLRVRFSIQ
jgi:TonB family protein